RDPRQEHARAPRQRARRRGRSVGARRGVDGLRTSERRRARPAVRLVARTWPGQAWRRLVTRSTLDSPRDGTWGSTGGFRLSIDRALNSVTPAGLARTHAANAEPAIHK